MKIGRNSEEPQRRLGPPPNYGSRGVQLRMFLLLALLMGVMTAIYEARNPERWKWLWAFEQPAVDVGHDIDPRLKLKADTPQTTEDLVLGGESPAEKARKQQEQAEQAAEDAQLAVNERAWVSGWREVHSHLSNLDRRVVYEILRRNRTPEVETTPIENATESLTELNRLWEAYLADAKRALLSLTEEERTAWTTLLDDLSKRWTSTIKPPLRFVAEGRELDAAEMAHLTELQNLLDRIELKRVEDDSPWRNSEREIWFRLFGQLKASTKEQLKAESAGLVSYAQLFKQSKTYRGQLVTVRGRASAVYSIRAIKNDYGIQQYWVFWLFPEGGPKSPLVVYSLNKPTDFPSIKEEEVSIKPMPSQEDVEFTGYFFKRHAYAAKTGIYVAPTLFALEPEWLKAPPPPAPPQLSLLQATALVMGLALFAAGFATWVYYSYRPNVRRDASELSAQFPPSTPSSEADEVHS
jgi:hypothetical protein